MVELSIPPSNVKRSKKPVPLFGLFRKSKPTDPIRSPRIDQLGSGFNVPVSSIVPEPTLSDPYAPPNIKSTYSSRKTPCTPNSEQTNARHHSRPRSKSLGKDSSAHSQFRPCARSLTVREQTLNKLCQRELLGSNADAVPPSHPIPPLPAIPVQHQGIPMSPRKPTAPITTAPNSPLLPNHHHGIRKISSAHDLHKAAKHQRDRINATVERIPLPKVDLARSRSLNTPKKPRLPEVTSEVPLPSNNPARQAPRLGGHIRVASASDSTRRYDGSSRGKDDDDDDDDIPLAAAAGMIPLSAASKYRTNNKHRPSSLLNDNDEDEDDKDLVPIAVLTQKESIRDQDEYLSAADKYKEKVKERLNLDKGNNDDDDDDDIPISISHMRTLRNQPQQTSRPAVMDMWSSPATQMV
ncbi:hypothetical protein EC973_004581 [Apophysomyces ossiformis]|uniref:Uncharacterized protein n=1 Tax=Apophysomyces ossiformis TaxID=679940 RepID=A0A8H7BS98_9FUNG|nr:hypothetical protein EC973_004581 [Apophysomyces ossiformis]